MKVENKTTVHNRTIRLTDLPKIGEMEITVNYIHADSDVSPSRTDKAVILDNFVIPAIIESINKKRRKKS